MISLARQKNEKAEAAYNLYLQGMKLVDIARKLGVPEGTVRRWKHDHKWPGERSGTKSERSETKRTEKTAPEIQALVESKELTDKEKLFCIEYVKCFNGAKAARKAGYAISRDRQTAFRMLHTPRILAEIERLRIARFDRAMLSADDIFARMIDIAFSDIGDFVEFRRELAPVMTAFGPLMGEDRQPVMKPVNRVWFRDSYETDNTLISEVKQGKDGASIKLLDKMRALEWLAARMDLLPTDVRQKLEFERRKYDDPNTDAIDKVDKLLEGIEGDADR